jgi:hypothetical protein
MIPVLSCGGGGSPFSPRLGYMFPTQILCICHREPKAALGYIYQVMGKNFLLRSGNTSRLLKKEKNVSKRIPFSQGTIILRLRNNTRLLRKHEYCIEETHIIYVENKNIMSTERNSYSENKYIFSTKHISSSQETKLMCQGNTHCLRREQEYFDRGQLSSTREQEYCIREQISSTRRTRKKKAWRNTKDKEKNK